MNTPGPTNLTMNLNQVVNVQQELKHDIRSLELLLHPQPEALWLY